MTEKRFENRLDKSNVKFNTLNPTWDNEKETGLNVFEMMDLLNKYDTEYTMCHNDVLRLEKENEQLKKDVEYWKQVAIQYSNELNVNDSTKSRNDKEKNCGYCKNYNLDGMFGIWCSIHETPTHDKYCQDFEWNR